ncbi:MAG: hypothetical protein KBS76_01870, partial [Ruminococcus sp.]|nr:hypothetical protein [Candidatus Apopatosoma intestinale]
GRWTMQMLYETMLEASTDVNGDSQLTFEAGDVFGMVDDGNHNIIKGLFAAAGIDGVVKNELGVPVPLDPSNEATTQRVIDTVAMDAKIFTAPTFGLIGEENCVKSIASGQALFMPQYMLRLHCTDELVVYGVDISDTKLSVLPFPKLEEEQERYYSFVCNRATSLRVSRAIDNPTEVANFLEVFGFHSQKLLYPQYVNYLRTQCLDGKDGDMLDYILENRHFDLGTFLERGIATTVRSVVSAGKSNISTYISRTYNGFCTDVNDYLDRMRNELK